MRRGRLDSKSTSGKRIEGEARTKTGHVPTMGLLCCLSCSHCLGKQGEQRMARNDLKLTAKRRGTELDGGSAGKGMCEDCLQVDVVRLGRSCLCLGQQ